MHNRFWTWRKTQTPNYSNHDGLRSTLFTTRAIQEINQSRRKSGISSNEPDHPSNLMMGRSRVEFDYVIFSFFPIKVPTTPFLCGCRDIFPPYGLEWIGWRNSYAWTISSGHSFWQMRHSISWNVLFIFMAILGFFREVGVIIN